MIQSLSLAVDGCLVGQEIPCFYNFKLHLCIHDSMQLDPVLSQLNSFSIFTLCFSKINLNIKFLLRISPPPPLRFFFCRLTVN